MISSALTDWKGEGKDRKGRFVINLKRQSKHWLKVSVNMETFQFLGMSTSGRGCADFRGYPKRYSHFYLYPRMIDCFPFRYNGRCYRGIALPFNCRRSVLGFTKLLLPLLKHLRERLGYRVLPYIDDSACAPSPLRRASTRKDCARAGRRLSRLFAKLGLVIHPRK